MGRPYGKPVLAGQSRQNLDSDSSLKSGHRGIPATHQALKTIRGSICIGEFEVELFVGQALHRGLVRAIFIAGSAGKCKD